MYPLVNVNKKLRKDPPIFHGKLWSFLVNVNKQRWKDAPPAIFFNGNTHVIWAMFNGYVTNHQRVSHLRFLTETDWLTFTYSFWGSYWDCCLIFTDWNLVVRWHTVSWYWLLKRRSHFCSCVLSSGLIRMIRHGNSENGCPREIQITWVESL